MRPQPSRSSSPFRGAVLALILALGGGAGLVPTLSGQGAEASPRLDALASERSACVVRVQYFIQRELDRQPTDALGIVLDDQGTILLVEAVVPQWLPASQFKDFRVFAPGDTGQGRPARYLGVDRRDGLHYVQVDEAGRQGLKSFDTWGLADIRQGDPVWGLSLLPRDFDSVPFIHVSHVGLIQELPFPVAVTIGDVAGIGGPVFDTSGRFAGWAGLPIPRDYLLVVGSNQMRASLRSPEDTNNFVLAPFIREARGRRPEAPSGRPFGWIGVASLQPVDPDVARFLGLERQGAVVVGNVVPDGPAQRAGLQDRDIILSVDGEPLRRFRPDAVVVRALERALIMRPAGSQVRLGVVRGEERLEIVVTIEEAPTNASEAPREWFPTLGFTAREFLVGDAIGRRISAVRERSGGLVSFVRPNSPASTAGLRDGDWIKEVDGEAVADLPALLAKLRAAAEDTTRRELVLLVERGGSETQVLRLSLR